MVKVDPKGYKQQSFQCGIIDGTGNEIISVSEELAEIVAPTGNFSFSNISYKESFANIVAVHRKFQVIP